MFLHIVGFLFIAMWVSVFICIAFKGNGHGKSEGTFVDEILKPTKEQIEREKLLRNL